MAKIAQMPALGVVNALRGVLDFYTWCNLVIVRKWPRSPGRFRNPYVTYTGSLFAYINQMAAEIPPDIKEFYEPLASQSGLSWKDWLTRLYINPGTRVHLIQG